MPVDKQQHGWAGSQAALNNEGHDSKMQTQRTAQKQGWGQDIILRLGAWAPVIASVGARAYIGGWGRTPNGGPGGTASVGGQGAKPPEAESSVAFEG